MNRKCGVVLYGPDALLLGNTPRILYLYVYVSLCKNTCSILTYGRLQCQSIRHWARVILGQSCNSGSAGKIIIIIGFAVRWNYVCCERYSRCNFTNLLKANAFHRCLFIVLSRLRYYFSFMRVKFQSSWSVAKGAPLICKYAIFHPRSMERIFGLHIRIILSPIVLVRCN